MKRAKLWQIFWNIDIKSSGCYTIIRSEQIARTKSKKGQKFKNPQQIVEKSAENPVNLPIGAYNTEGACNTGDACNTEDEFYTEDANSTRGACNIEDASNTKEDCTIKDAHNRFYILRKKDESISDKCKRNHLGKGATCLQWLF